MLVIRKLKNTRCFEGTRSLPAWYRTHRKARRMQQLFENYIRRLYQNFELEEQVVLPFISSCACMASLIPSTKHGIQPVDQGVIQKLEANRWRQLLSHTLLCYNGGRTYSMPLLLATSMLTVAWKVLTSQALRKCFRHVRSLLFRARTLSQTVILCPVFLLLMQMTC